MQMHIPATSRGRSRFSWLDSHHTFSFGHYHDPGRMGFGALRVLNDDRVQPGAGFDTHGHRDMEILSYVTGGEMVHRDSSGHEGRIAAGQFQLMSAGSGILHSEYNASPDEELRFLQVWILPALRGGQPAYQQRDFARVPGLQPIATPDGRDATLKLRQDAIVSRLILPAGTAHALAPGAGRRLYLHLVEGALGLGDTALAPGDGFGLAGAESLETRAASAVEALLFDLPPAD